MPPSIDSLERHYQTIESGIPAVAKSVDQLAPGLSERVKALTAEAAKELIEKCRNDIAALTALVRKVADEQEVSAEEEAARIAREEFRVESADNIRVVRDLAYKLMTVAVGRAKIAAMREVAPDESAPSA